MSTALQVLGILVLAAGLFMLAPWLGIAALGLLLLLLGIAIEVDVRSAHGPRKPD